MHNDLLTIIHEGQHKETKIRLHSYDELHMDKPAAFVYTKILHNVRVSFYH